MCDLSKKTILPLDYKQKRKREKKNKKALTRWFKIVNYSRGVWLCESNRDVWEIDNHEIYHTLNFKVH